MMSENTKKVLRTVSKIVLLLVGLFLIGYVGYMTYLSVRYKPYKVRVTNVTDSAFTVSWVTDYPMAGVVFYGEKDNFLPGPLGWMFKKKALDDRDFADAQTMCVEKFNQQSKDKNPDFVVDGSNFDCENITINRYGKYYTHHITVKGLDADKEYYFNVGNAFWSWRVNKGEYIENEIKGIEKFTTKTLPIITKVESPKPAYGSIVDTYYNEWGMLVENKFFDSLVFLKVEGAGGSTTVLSSVSNMEGGWSVDLANARDVDGSIINLGNSDLTFIGQAENLPLSKIYKSEYVEVDFPIFILASDEKDWRTEGERDLNWFERIIKVFSFESRAQMTRGKGQTTDGDRTKSFSGGRINPFTRPLPRPLYPPTSPGTKEKVSSSTSTPSETGKKVSSSTEGEAECSNPVSSSCEPGNCYCGESGAYVPANVEECRPANCFNPNAGGGTRDQGLAPVLENGEVVLRKVTKDNVNEVQKNYYQDPYLNSVVQATVKEATASFKPTRSSTGGVSRSGTPGCTYYTHTANEGPNRMYYTCEERVSEARCETITEKPFFSSYEHCLFSLGQSPASPSEGDSTFCQSGYVKQEVSENGESKILCMKKDDADLWNAACASFLNSNEKKLVEYQNLQSTVPLSGTFDCAVGKKTVAIALNWRTNLPIEVDRLHYSCCQRTNSDGSVEYITQHWQDDCDGGIKRFLGIGTHCDLGYNVQYCLNNNKVDVQVSLDKTCPNGTSPIEDTGKSSAVGGFYCCEYIGGKFAVQADGVCPKISRKNWSNCIGNLERKDIQYPQNNNILRKYVQTSNAQESTPSSETSILFLPEDGMYSVDLLGNNNISLLGDGNTGYFFYLERNGINGYQSAKDAGNPLPQEDVPLNQAAAVISTNQVTSGKKLSLKQGINIVSFDFFPALDKEKALEASEFMKLANVGDFNVSKISTFVGGAWQGGVVYDPQMNDTKGDSFPLIFGKGYVILAEKDVTVTVPGYQIQSSIPIAFSAGWNLVGVHGYSKAYTARSFIDSINTINGLKANNVSWWPTAKGMYEGLQVTDGKEYGLDFPISPLNGYFVRINEFKPEREECKSIIWHEGGELNGKCGDSKTILN